jgi:hypothetical protein
MGVQTLSFGFGQRISPSIVRCYWRALFDKRDGTPGQIRTDDSQLSRLPLFEVALTTCGRLRDIR